jgi:nicotinamidase-related amidase
MKSIGHRSFYSTLEEIIDPSHTAVLVIDQQNDFCHPDGFYAADLKLDVSMLQKMTPAINLLTDAARTAGATVVFTQNVIKKGFVSDSPLWLGIHAAAGLKSLDQERFYVFEGTWGAEIYDEVVVKDTDFIVPKLRSNAFHDTPLDALLRNNGVESVIIAGQVTEGCVESTIRGARDRDFYTVLARDTIGSTSLERHDRIMANWLPRSHCPTAAEIAELWSTLR